MRPFRRRGSLRGPVVLAVVVAAALLSECDGGQGGGGDPSLSPGGELGGSVVDVVDGDTIEVRLEDGSIEDVRYIGIDTPESVKPGSPVECGGPEASDANEALVGGREVLLVLDAEVRDRFGRLLAYVYLPTGGDGSAGRGLLVNAELVRRGLARTLEIAPNDSLAPLFEKLAAQAGRAGRGLWGSCGRL